jgi:hypothetical protein
MQEFNFKITIGNLRSMDEVKASLEKVGLICEIQSISIVKHNLKISSPELMTDDDILSLGCYIGTIQASALM